MIRTHATLQWIICVSVQQNDRFVARVVYSTDCSAMRDGNVRESDWIGSSQAKPSQTPAARMYYTLGVVRGALDCIQLIKQWICLKFISAWQHNIFIIYGRYATLSWKKKKPPLPKCYRVLFDLINYILYICILINYKIYVDKPNIISNNFSTHSDQSPPL